MELSILNVCEWIIQKVVWRKNLVEELTELANLYYKQKWTIKCENKEVDFNHLILVNFFVDKTLFLYYIEYKFNEIKINQDRQGGQHEK